MSNFLTRAQTVLAREQPTAGVDPFGGTGDLAFGVRLQPPTLAPNLETFNPEEVGGGLDASGDLPAGGNLPFQAGIVARGVATPGTAPSYAAFLKACTLGETLFAGVTGTATAGTTDTITLADATGVQRGMVLILTGGAGFSASAGKAQNWRMITGVAGNVVTVDPDFAVAPGATTTYQVPACALYRPVSTGIPWAAIYAYLQSQSEDLSLLQRILESRGSLNIDWSVRRPAIINVNMLGQLNEEEEVTPAIGTPTYSTAPAPSLMSGVVYYNSTIIRPSQFTFDLAGEVQMADDPWAAFGYGSAAITRRQPGVTLVVPKQKPSVANALAAWRDQTTVPAWVAAGETAGGRISLYAPQVRAGAPNRQDNRGFVYESQPSSSIEPNAGIFYSIF